MFSLIEPEWPKMPSCYCQKALPCNLFGSMDGWPSPAPNVLPPLCFLSHFFALCLLVSQSGKVFFFFLPRRKQGLKCPPLIVLQAVKLLFCVSSTGLLYVHFLQQRPSKVLSIFYNVELMHPLCKLQCNR